MAPLRIGLDYRPALLTSTGIGRYVRELCRAFAALGEDRVQLRLFGHSLARARRDDVAMDPRLRLHRLPIPGRTLPTLARLGVDAARLSGGVDIFHYTDYIHPPTRRGPRVLTLHDVAFAEDESFFGREQAATLLSRCRLAAASADLIVTPTEASRCAVMRTLGVAAEQIVVVPFGSDHVPPPSQRADHPRDGRPFVLALGTVEPRKNHLRLLAAWRRLPEPRPEFVVMGKPGWAPDAVAALTAAEQNGEVEWHRQPSDAQVWQHLCHATLLAYPSHLEGFGFPPLEAMAMGTPVLAGDNPALREVCGSAARFVTPTDTDHIATELAGLLADKEARATLRERGLGQSRRFSWRACAEKHCDLWLQLQADNRREAS